MFGTFLIKLSKQIRNILGFFDFFLINSEERENKNKQKSITWVLDQLTSMCLENKLIHKSQCFFIYLNIYRLFVFSKSCAHDGRSHSSEKILTRDKYMKRKK